MKWLGLAWIATVVCVYTDFTDHPLGVVVYGMAAVVAMILIKEIIKS